MNRILTKTVLLFTALIASPIFLAGNALAKEEPKAVAVKCPAGIDHSGWDRLLKKYVDGKGLVNYAAWKASKTDMVALRSYLETFKPKNDKMAEGNEKAASLVNAYNAFTVYTILGAYPVESINEIDKLFG